MEDDEHGIKRWKQVKEDIGLRLGRSQAHTSCLQGALR